MTDEFAGRSEVKDVAQAVTGDIVVFRGVLLRVSNEERSSNILNVERRKAGKDKLIVERLGREMHLVEARVINLEAARAEIRDVEETFAANVGRGHAFIDRTIAII